MVSIRGRACWIGLVSTMAILFSACSETTMTPSIRANRGLARPDRVLVYDFAVTPGQAGVELRSGTVTQTEEDLRVGKSLASAVTTNLISELRARGIEAEIGSASAAAGDSTATLRGRFLRSEGVSATTTGFTLRDKERRTLVQLFQGTGLKLQIVGEGEIVTPSQLRPGTVTETAIDADAKRTAQVLAERIAQYYRQEGWIQ
jgi:hypothetical protein